MIYHNQNKDHYPYTTAVWRAEATVRFTEISGPRYEDLAFEVAAHYPAYSAVESDEGPAPIYPADMSYSSWLMLRATPEGQTVMLKIRTDEVARGR